MIDMQAFRSIVREAIGVRAVMHRDPGNSAGLDESLATLVRCIGYLLGGQYRSDPYARLVTAVRAVIDEHATDHHRQCERGYCGRPRRGSPPAARDGGGLPVRVRPWR